MLTILALQQPRVRLRTGATVDWKGHSQSFRVIFITYLRNFLKKFFPLRHTHLNMVWEYDILSIPATYFSTLCLTHSFVELQIIESHKQLQTHGYFGYSPSIEISRVAYRRLSLYSRE